MRQTLRLASFGHATSALLAISYMLCVGFDLLFPALAMHGAWQALLPGFHWLSFPSLILGLLESYVYGWYAALIWVPIYNVGTARGSRR